MEYQPKKVKIQNIKTGKITDVTQVAWDVMVKHKMTKDYVIINPEMVVNEVPVKKSKKKAEIPAETIVEPIENTEQQNQDIQ